MLSVTTVGSIRLHILIVEDDPGDVTLLQEAFLESRSRATISVARDGEECLRILQATSAAAGAYPDLILLDLHLPTVSGYDVLRQLKTDGKTRHIPIIILSSAQNGDEISRAYAEYANAYVQKPSTLADLIAAARSLNFFWMETARLSSAFPVA